MTSLSKIWKQLTSILSNLNNFHSLEVVDRVSETQLQVGENSDWIIWRWKGSVYTYISVRVSPDKIRDRRQRYRPQQYTLGNPFNAEILDTNASPPLNPGMGWGKSKYFVLSDWSEDTSRILAYEQIITREGAVHYWCITLMSCQGHIKVISGQTGQKYWKKCPLLSISTLLVVQSSTRNMVIHSQSSIISTYIFRKFKALSILGGKCSHICPYYTPFLKAQLNKQNYNYVAACNISLGFKYGHITGYERWHGVTLCFTVWIPLKINM